MPADIPKAPAEEEIKPVDPALYQTALDIT